MTATHSRRSIVGIVLLIALIPLWGMQCDRHDPLVGSYRADAAGPQGRISAMLELQPNGKGLWSTDTDNAPFRWNLRRNTIQLHTPTGGVIQGTVDRDTIELEIPGTGLMTFRRER